MYFSVVHILFVLLVGFHQISSLNTQVYALPPCATILCSTHALRVFTCLYTTTVQLIITLHSHCITALLLLCLTVHLCITAGMDTMRILCKLASSVPLYTALYYTLYTVRTVSAAAH
jgi:hypothetical protein